MNRASISQTNQGIPDNAVSRINIFSPYISDLCLKIRDDIVYLRENLHIITEEYENKLLIDIESFLLNEIVKEIRITLYDPMQNNRVHVEYCYKIDLAGSSPSNFNQGGNVNIFTLPETIMFDVFLYFTENFLMLEPDQQTAFFGNCKIDWFDLDFTLKYRKKKNRNVTDVINFNGLSAKRSLFEYEKSVVEKQTAVIRPKTEIDVKSDESVDPEFRRAVVKAILTGQKLNYVIYSNLDSALNTISNVLFLNDKSPIRWSLSRGFVLESLSDDDIGDINSRHNTRDPAVALDFVIGNLEERVSYIFEDFHHHIGGASSINSSVAEIRSLIRDLSRSLKERDEYVFFLSPADSLPIELVPLFNIIKQEAVEGVSLLSRYGSSLTDPQTVSRYKPVIGRDNQIRRIIQVLCQMETNNPLIVGEPGVGKTALVEGLASEIVKGNVPSMLKGKEIFSINLNTLVAGSRYRGDFEERINGLLEDVKSHSGNMIVFIDEIHTLMGAGSSEGSAGAEDVLKPALARGDFPCIGATTFEGYRYLLKDPALSRRFQKIEIKAATDMESEEILKGVLSVFEKHHGVRIDEGAVKTAVVLSNEYLHDQFLPGKAIRILDSASAYVKLDGRETVFAEDIEEEIRRSVY